MRRSSAERKTHVWASEGAYSQERSAFIEGCAMLGVIDNPLNGSFICCAAGASGHRGWRTLARPFGLAEAADHMHVSSYSCV